MDLTRQASTASQRDSPAAIAAASRNAIQEAKNRKAAARARMAQRDEAIVQPVELRARPFGRGGAAFQQAICTG